MQDLGLDWFPAIILAKIGAQSVKSAIKQLQRFVSIDVNYRSVLHFYENIMIKWINSQSLEDA